MDATVVSTSKSILRSEEGRGRFVIFLATMDEQLSGPSWEVGNLYKAAVDPTLELVFSSSTTSISQTTKPKTPATTILLL